MHLPMDALQLDVVITPLTMIPATDNIHSPEAEACLFPLNMHCKLDVAESRQFGSRDCCPLVYLIAVPMRLRLHLSRPSRFGIPGILM